MRHLDYLLDEWDLASESEAVQRCVQEIRDGVDRYYIYLEAVGEGSELDPAVVYRTMFSRGWFGQRWGLRRQLGLLFRSALVDDRIRPTLWFVRGQSRRTERLLRRLERARQALDLVALDTIRTELETRDKSLATLVKRKGYELFREPSDHRCPKCAGRFVTREEFFGGTVLLGCELCAHAESAREKSGELEQLLSRWKPPAD